jgi:gas vesicle protein
MADNNRTGILWLVAGIGLGVVAGILYAPRSGGETRKALRSNAEHGRDRLRHHANRVRERAADWADRGRAFLDRKGPAKADLATKAMDAVEDSAGRAGRVTSDAASHIVDVVRKAV